MAKRHKEWHQNLKIGKKIKEYFSEIGMSQTEAADRLGVQQTAVSNQINGRSFGKNSAAKWNAAFGFRTNWLLTGEGPMFDHQDKYGDEESFNNEAHHELNHENNIPVVPTNLVRTPEIDIYKYVTTSPNVDRLPPIPHIQKHDFFARCPGDAMAPRIQRGYLLALRRQEPGTPIINGEIYAVDTKSNGMFVRKIIDNGGTLTFVAENQVDYPDFELPYEDILSISRVVGVLIANI